MEIEIGVDEAGRGPVLGPLVYGCAWWPYGIGDEMRNVYDLKDSKKTTDAERRCIYDQLQLLQGKEGYGFAVSVTMPEDLSNEMLANGGKNLNDQSYLSTAKLLNEVLAKGFKVKTIYLDQLGPPMKHIS